MEIYALILRYDIMDNNILQLHIIKTIFEYFDNMIDLLSFAFTNKFIQKIIFDNVSKSQILKIRSEKDINALKYIVNFIQKYDRCLVINDLV